MDSAVVTQTESARLLRIRSLSTELDTQRQLVADRSKTLETKASFVLVVVGLVGGVSFARLADSPLWLISLLPGAVALTAAIMAVLVLWPRPIEVVEVDGLVDKWVDSHESQEALEDYLLESKRREIAARDNKHKQVTPHLKRAFWLLLISVSLLIVVGVADGYVPTASSGPSIPPTSPTPGANS